METIETERDAAFYEIIDGVRRECEMGAFQTILATTIVHILATVIERDGLGWYATETLFQLDDDGDLQLRPDIAFVSNARWPEDLVVPEERNAIKVVPDLVVEVVIPSNSVNEVITKVRTYFRVGCRRVWVVIPASREVYDYASPANVTILGWDDTIRGGDVVPGFESKVSAFYRKVLPNG